MSWEVFSPFLFFGRVFEEIDVPILSWAAPPSLLPPLPYRNCSCKGLQCPPHCQIQQSVLSHRLTLSNSIWSQPPSYPQQQRLISATILPSTTASDLSRRLTLSNSVWHISFLLRALSASGLHNLLGFFCLAGHYFPGFFAVLSSSIRYLNGEGTQGWVLDTIFLSLLRFLVILFLS